VKIKSTEYSCKVMYHSENTEAAHPWGVGSGIICMVVCTSSIKREFEIGLRVLDD